jgi:hypothetical protein
MAATNMNEILLNKIKQASNPNQNEHNPSPIVHPRYRIEIRSPRTKPNLAGATEPIFSPEETALLVVTAAMIDALDGVLPEDLLNLGNTPSEILSKASILKDSGTSSVSGLSELSGLGWLLAHSNKPDPSKVPLNININIDAPIVCPPKRGSSGGIDINALFELKLMECAYKILGNPKYSNLLKGGQFDTGAERLAYIEEQGVEIKGGAPGIVSAPQAFLDIHMNPEVYTYDLSIPAFEGGGAEDKLVSWREITPLLNKPQDVRLPYKVKNLNLSNITDKKLNIHFEQGSENCSIKNTKLAGLYLQSVLNENENQQTRTMERLKLGNVKINDWNIESGWIFNNCEFINVKANYLTQQGDPDVLDNPEDYIPGDTPVVFNHCILDGFQVIHPEDASTDLEWDPLQMQPGYIYEVPGAYLHNWEFHGGHCRDVDLPRSYLPARYTFNGTGLEDVQFKMPKEGKKHINNEQAIQPRGILDLDLVCTSIYSPDVRAPSLKEVQPNDGAATIRLSTPDDELQCRVFDLPGGHWNTIMLAPNANVVFGDISASATCEEVCFLKNNVLDEIDLKYLPAKWRIFLKGDTADPKRVAALSGLNLNDEGKTTQAAYFRALLQQMVVPGNVDAINRVLTNTNTNTNTNADKEHANKSGRPNRLKP